MPELSHRRRMLVLAICCMSLLIVSLDATALNVALPSMQKELHAGVSGLQWTIDAYTLVLASLLMLSGSTADRVTLRAHRPEDADGAYEQGADPLSRQWTTVPLDNTRTDGLEHLFRWRASIFAAAGKDAQARAAEARAAAEVEQKAQKLRDPELRKHFLASRKRAV